MSDAAAQSGVGEVNGCTTLAGSGGGKRPSGLTVGTCPDGDRTVVTLSGDLDLSVDQELQQALRATLARSDHGIELDLGGVRFCDCSGLNILLGIRQQALAESKTVTIRGISPAAERVFALTGTLSLFAPDGDEAREEDDDPAQAAAEGSDAPDQDPRVEVVQLRRAMQTREVIDLARGILMAAFTLSSEEAWSVLVMTSQNTNTKLYRAAQQLVDSIQGDPLPESVQNALSAAVAHVAGSRAAAVGPE
ncbi:anti-sigma factor antagonist [Streptomyces sp. NPDC047043]|uniref:anti-sigma factor antagonist n=1 Tax=Streptomyces sp. NPDC047043 TaxID=3154497 RepID=UPI0033DE0F23